jgi:hypothetical protein
MTIVTFDFDDTLTMTQWDPSAERFRYVGPNRRMLLALEQHLAAGDQVHVVVARLDPEYLDDPDSQPAPGAWLRAQLGEAAASLAGVHFTSQDLKWRLLHMLDSTKHYDDDPCEIEALPPGCTGVRVETLHGL